MAGLDLSTRSMRQQIASALKAELSPDERARIARELLHAAQ